MLRQQPNSEGKHRKLSYYNASLDNGPGNPPTSRQSSEVANPGPQQPCLSRDVSFLPQGTQGWTQYLLQHPELSTHQARRALDKLLGE